MHFKLPSLLGFLLIAANCFSQEQRQSDITDITKVTFLNPGISYEKRIAKFQSLYAQAFMNTSAYWSYSSTFGTSSSIYFDPALAIQYRFYYNAVQRQAKGKRTEMNSLNYITPLLETIFTKRQISSSYFEEAKRRAITTLGVAWGFQRNYSKRFSLDLYLGLGYLFTTSTAPDMTGLPVVKHTGQVASIGQLNLGFWLNKKK